MPKRRRAVLLCGPARATLAAIARELARTDTSLLIQASPAEVAASEQLCRVLARRGVAAQVVGAELGGDADARQLVARAWKAAPAIDAVVICPTPSVTAGATDPSLDEWQDGMAAGLRAPFFVAKHAGLRLAGQGGRLIFALSAPSRRASPVAGVVHAGLRCMIDGLAKALPSRVAVTAVIGGGRPAAADTAQIAAGVRLFIEAERRVSGAILELAAAVGRG